MFVVSYSSVTIHMGILGPFLILQGVSMTLSLTCACGARLEIDAKFVGQTIHCPDCNRQLETGSPAAKPAHTSGYALASLVLALAGAFTLAGTVAAIVCGALGLKQIRQAPTQI